MMVRALLLAAALACGTTRAVLGQEGHPLTGTWSGDWGPSSAQRNHITIVMNWDGTAVTGVLNPGPDAVPLKSVTLDVANWTVRLEAEAKAKDQSGGAVPISADGRLDDIGSYKRTLTGSWIQGTVKGDFRLTRN